MIGSAKPVSKTRSDWLSRLRQGVHRYIGVDGGSGAHLLADLAGRDPYLQQVSSPRHADLLVVIEPISQKLVPAVVMMAAALAHPSRVLLVGEPQTERTTLPDVNFARLDNLFPSAHRVPSSSIEQIMHAVRDANRWSDMSIIEATEQEETTLQLPAKQDQEMATELAVLSLGPLQAFTAGPLRLFLICDGEQVFSVQMETEYASRGINHAMTQGDWQHGLLLARQFDPLAPLAGQLAYVRALEQLQGWQPATPLHASRELVLALERTYNTLWWLVRFARLLADPVLAKRSYQLARQLTEVCSHVWQRPAEEWLLPHYDAPYMFGNKNFSAHIQQIADGTKALQQYVGHNRGLALRTRGIGILTTEQLATHGVTGGPVFAASEHGRGDVQSRLETRLHTAVEDLHSAAEILSSLTAHHAPTLQEASWDVPLGEANTIAEGPRGALSLHLVHQQVKEHDGPTQIEWQGPSAPLVALLPELLVGQKLADAEVTLASLDIVMAEVDG
ncbi:MAG: hypothetical protein PVSMB2_02890 [Ktedonobacteraceae bacterium]